MRPACLLALSALLLSTPARAEDAADRSGVMLDVPLVDLPFNARSGLRWPSMQQSLALSSDFYQMLHFGLGQAIDPYEGETWRKVLGKVVIGASDLLLTNFPLGLAWQHEEGHRAVLSHEKISSFNGVYRFRLFDQMISVNKVSDEDLRAFKARDPAGFVRMSTAGLETSLELVTSLEKTQLYHGTRAWHGVLFWQVYLTNSLYLAGCASKQSNSASDEAEKDEGADVSKRDFTGSDCNAWVYDLFRPNEPYGARGDHPSGVGIRRYIRYSDMTSAEQSYLRRQAYLSLLNFIDPALIGFDWFETTLGARQQTLRVNAHVRHTPAPFGQSIGLEAYGQYGEFNGLVGLAAGLDHDRVFPSLNVELHRFPLDLVIGVPISVSARTALWLQPKGLLFQDAPYRPGALGSLRLAYSFARSFEPYVEVEGKSAGWVPANVWLQPNVSVRMGLVASLFN